MERIKRIGTAWIVLLLVLAGFGLEAIHSDAAPKAVAPQYSIAAINSAGTIDHRVLLGNSLHTGTSTTPVNGSTVCISGDPSKFLVSLSASGTVVGGNTATIANVIQESDDGGLTWKTIRTAVTFNSTAVTTPANLRQDFAFSDVAASTAEVHGDCYRVQTTYGANGNGMTFGLTLLAK